MKQPPEVSEEFIERMREKHPELDVENEIEGALSHKAALNWGKTELYVQNWLRKSQRDSDYHMKRMGYVKPSQVLTEVSEFDMLAAQIADRKARHGIAR